MPLSRKFSPQLFFNTDLCLALAFVFVSSQGESGAHVGVALVAALLLWQTHPNRWPPAPLPVVPIVVVSVVILRCWVSLWTSSSPGETFLATSKWIGGLFLLGGALTRGVDRERIVPVVVGVGGTQSILILGRWVFGGPDFSLFPEMPQFTAYWLAAAAVVALGSITNATSRRRWLDGFWAGAMVAALLLLRSRSGLVSLAVGVGAFLLFRWRMRGAIVLGLCGVAILLWAPHSLWEILDKTTDPLSWRRWDIWKTAWNGISDRPLWGWGAGEFGALAQHHAVPQNMGDVRLRILTPFAHNDYLQVWAELGTVVFGFLVAGGVWGTRRIDWRRSSPAAPFLAALFGACAFLTFNHPWGYFPNAVLTVLLIAGSVSHTRLVTKTGVNMRWAQRPVQTVLFVFLGIHLFVAMGSWLTLDKKSRWGETSPLWRVDPLIQRAEEKMHRATPLSDEDRRDVEDTLHKAHRRRPRDTRVHQWLAHFYAEHALPPRPTDVERVLEDGLGYSPLNPLLHNALGWARLRDGNPLGAAAAFQNALRLEPRYAEASLGLGVSLTERGHPERALRWLTVAQKKLVPPEAIRFWPVYPQSILSQDPAHFQTEIERAKRLLRSHGKKNSKNP